MKKQDTGTNAEADSWKKSESVAARRKSVFWRDIYTYFDHSHDSCTGLKHKIREPSPVPCRVHAGISHERTNCKGKRQLT